MAAAVTLHLLAAVVWVGGMFFAHMALRIAVGDLEPPVRLALMARTLGLFFNWVWMGIIILLVTGIFMIGIMGGFGAMPTYVLIMFIVGVAMMLIFMHIYFGPFKRLKAGVAASDTQSAAKAMGQVRTLVTLNLVLGLLTIVIAKGFKFL